MEHACRVELDRAAGTATVLLDDPARRNAFSPALSSGLSAALDAVENDAAIRAVVLAAAGPAFCVGGDLDQFAADMEAGNLVPRMTEAMGAFGGVIVRLVACPVPVVAALHGAVAGGGLALAAACDLRVCNPGTVFAPGFAGIGLPPDTGTSWLLPRLMGIGRATEFLLRNQRLDAAAALAGGLVNEVVDEPRRRAGEIAEELARGPRRALADTKALLGRTFMRTFDEQLHEEEAAVMRAVRGPELGEGVRAFLARRRPSFPD